MRKVQGEILQGCKLILRGNVLTRTKELCHLSKMAEKMGAICVSEIDPSVTHVVTMDQTEAKDDHGHGLLKNAKK